MPRRPFSKKRLGQTALRGCESWRMLSLERAGEEGIGDATFVPQARRVSRQQEYRTAAATLGLEYHELPLPQQGGLVPAFDQAVSRGIDVLLVDATILTKQHMDQIVALAAERRLPAIYRERPFVAAGGLASYGEDMHDLFRRSASHVSRLLKSERPEDLPVEQATKFELIINMKAAKALGVEVPSSLLARADEVIE